MAQGNNTLVLSNTPTIQAAAYAAGQSIGGLITLGNVGHNGVTSGLLQSVIIVDKAKQNASVDVVFFSAQPTGAGTTITDKAAVAIDPADLTKIVGVVHLTDYTSFSANSVGEGQNQTMPYNCSSGSLFAVIVCRGTPTYTSNADISVVARLLQD